MPLPGHLPGSQHRPAAQRQVHRAVRDGGDRRHGGFIRLDSARWRGNQGADRGVQGRRAVARPQG